MTNTNEKTIPDWRTIRKTIEGIDDFKSKLILQISYLFGTNIQELIRGQTRKETVKGNDFFTKMVNGDEALILRIPTKKRGWRPRYVAAPLDSKCEPWSEYILRYSEENSNRRLYEKTTKSLQDDIKDKYFKQYEWPPIRYDKKTKKYVNRTSFTHKHLPELREWELGLRHNFNEFDFKHFFGKFYNSDYNVYFNKLLNTTDYYDSNDIINAIEIKNEIFSPRDRYFYKVYMDVQKLIKRKYISRCPPQKIPININVNYKEIPGNSGKKHKILQANMKKILEEKSNQVFCEDSNLDVIDVSNGIIAECGHTEASKLIDSFNEVFSGIETINEFRILQWYDEIEYLSDCYVFKKQKTYRQLSL